jgi:hypothetical protein
MPHMKRISTTVLACCLIALAIPVAAIATLSEVGVIGSSKQAAAPSCPTSPCRPSAARPGFR